MSQSTAEAVPPSILCFGEVLWDVFDGQEVIGGAPFNVAAHLARLGVHAFIYSRVGGDRRGAKIRDQAARFGVSDRWLQQDAARPTGWVDIELDASGQPNFRIGPNAAWDHIGPPTAAAIRELQATGFSAIVCGTLAARSPISRAALAAVRAGMPRVPVFYDVNLRGSETPIERVREILPQVSVLKVNAEEAGQLARALFGRTMTCADLFLQLRQLNGISQLLCTRGEEGCEVLAADRTFSSRPDRVDVVSAVGAGDAFSAAFLAGLVKGRSLERAAADANLLGAYVASSRETIPEYSEALRARLSNLP